MKYNRVYNFSAGPAMMPEPVLEEIRDEMMNYQGSGMCVMEMSHRSKVFQQIIDEAEADLRELMGIPDNYKVLFIQGGATLQFAMVPMNLMKNGVACYVETGAWSKKAIAEAKKYGEVHVVASSKDRNYSYIPDCSDLDIPENTDYVYICENETIHGVTWPKLPNTKGHVLVSDQSSMFLSRPCNVSDYGMIYAGVQKNVGPAGMVIAIIREDLIRDDLDPKVPLYCSYKTLEITCPHPEYFDLEPTSAQRLADRETVTVHRNWQPILRDGEIDQELLLSVVQENNAAYFKDEDRNLMHTPIEDEEEIRDVIRLISESIEYDLPKLSETEQDRLNCLLGDLKIVEASGLSLAAVVMETNVLYVNLPMIDVGQYASDNENAYRNTLYHEAKHLLQSDCPCYDGTSYRQTGTMRLPNGADQLDPFRNFWLIEGSAEKAACNQTGDAPMSYSNLVGYVESLDLAAVLSSQAENGQSIENCTLRRDTPGLLELLGGEGEGPTPQVLRLLWAMEIVQGYADALGETLGMTEDEFLDLRMEIKADCCLEIARCYYRNLALALENAQGVTLEDLYCLMAIFEGDFYYCFGCR